MRAGNARNVAWLGVHRALDHRSAHAPSPARRQSRQRLLAGAGQCRPVLAGIELIDWRHRRHAKFRQRPAAPARRSSRRRAAPAAPRPSAWPASRCAPARPTARACRRSPAERRQPGCRRAPPAPTPTRPPGPAQRRCCCAPGASAGVRPGRGGRRRWRRRHSRPAARHRPRCPGARRVRAPRVRATP